MSKPKVEPISFEEFFAILKEDEISQFKIAFFFDHLKALEDGGVKIFREILTIFKDTKILRNKEFAKVSLNSEGKIEDPDARFSVMNSIYLGLPKQLKEVIDVGFFIRILDKKTYTNPDLMLRFAATSNNYRLCKMLVEEFDASVCTPLYSGEEGFETLMASLQNDGDDLSCSQFLANEMVQGVIIQPILSFSEACLEDLIISLKEEDNFRFVKIATFYKEIYEPACNLARITISSDLPELARQEFSEMQKSISQDADSKKKRSKTNPEEDVTLVGATPAGSSLILRRNAAKTLVEMSQDQRR
jgi:hypothetical protein